MAWSNAEPASDNEFERMVRGELNHLAAYLKGREADGAFPPALTLALASALAQATVQFSEQRGVCPHEQVLKVVKVVLSHAAQLDGMAHVERVAADRARTH